MTIERRLELLNLEKEIKELEQMKKAADEKVASNEKMRETETLELSLEPELDKNTDMTKEKLRPMQGELLSSPPPPSPPTHPPAIPPPPHLSSPQLTLPTITAQPSTPLDEALPPGTLSTIPAQSSTPLDEALHHVKPLNIPVTLLTTPAQPSTPLEEAFHPATLPSIQAQSSIRLDETLHPVTPSNIPAQSSPTLDEALPHITTAPSPPIPAPQTLPVVKTLNKPWITKSTPEKLRPPKPTPLLTYLKLCQAGKGLKSTMSPPPSPPWSLMSL